MHIHILGICGTFMGGIAVLAKQLGHHVTGADTNIYPPMSTQLIEQGIELIEGYDPAQLNFMPDIVIVGNAMKRGNPSVEYILNQKLRYTSGPQWLAENVLNTRWVFAVAGTHGKTTTTSLLAWILEYARLNPGFLIGGIAKNFGISARLGDKKFFVVEADEYDTAFFDKRSKFIHYLPRTVILNNLEFDHADIFPDLAAIKTQFHHFVRTIPSNGLIVCPSDDQNIKDVLDKGCWTSVEYIGKDKVIWQARNIAKDGSKFDIYYDSKLQGRLEWQLLGTHNVYNALAAIAAAHHAGISTHTAIAALAEFTGIKRRLEIRGRINNVTVYDDFAHHPTAVATTLAGLRSRVGKERIIAVIELGSYTMRTGVHRDTIVGALKEADVVLIARPQQDWGVNEVVRKLAMPANVCDNVEQIIQHIQTFIQKNDHIIVMSNTGFDDIHEKLLEVLKNKVKHGNN